MTFSIARGTNLSHWLSQSQRRGVERKEFITQQDIHRIADWGFDHIRLPIDEEQLWGVDGNQDNEAFDLMESALDWAIQAGMSVIVDLHILRSHFFNATTEPKLFSDPIEAEKFAGMWRQLSARLGKRPLNRVAYELMNEAVAHDARNWNRVAALAFQAIRALEPQRTIVLGSNGWNSALTFDALDIPDDPNMILTFHYYRPMLVTHHRAWWCPEGKLYEGPIHYPGQPIAPDDLARIADPDRSRLANWNTPHDRHSMTADLSQPLAASRRTGLPLYCGEFGVYRLTPQPLRLSWYRDIISVFKEHKIAWANWDYKGDFGLLENGKSTGITEVLLAS